MADRTISVKLRAEVSQYMANMRAAGKATSDLEKASRQLQVAFDNEEDAAGKVRVAQAKLNEVQQKGKASASQLAAAQERLAAAQRQHARAQDETRIASERYLAVQKKTQDEVQKASKQTEQVAKRANIQWRLLLGALAVGGPAASAAALGVALAGVSAGFVGLSAVALRENAKVRDSFFDLGRTIKSDVAADAGVLEDELVGAAGEIGGAWQRLRPLMRQAFSASQDDVLVLTRGVTDFAENAMPGFVNAVESADPAVRGLRVLLADTGTGVAEFFNVFAEHSDAAGLGLEHLGSLIKGLLPEVGGILGSLTELWAEHGDEVSDVIVRIFGLINQLTSSALPGLSSGVSVALNILQSLLSVLEPMAPILGPIISGWLALSTAMRGMRAVSGAVTAAAASVARFGTASSSAVAGGSRLARASRSLVGVLGGPLGIAVAGAGLILNALGEKQARAAEQAREHEQRVRALTDAIRDDGGAIGQRTRELTEQSLVEVNAAANAERLGVSFRTVRDAALGNAQSLRDLRQSTQGTIDSALAGGDAWYQLDGAQGAAFMSAVVLRGTIDEQAKSLQEAKSKADAYATGMSSVSISTLAAEEGSANLQEALEGVADVTKTATERGEDLVRVLDLLSGRSMSYEDAMQSVHDAIREMGDASDVLSDKLVRADGSINTTSEAGSNLRTTVVGLREDMANAAGAVLDLTAAGVPLDQAIVQVNNDLQTARQRFINEATAKGLSRKAALRLADANGIGSQSLSVFLSRLSATDLKAAGVTKTIDKTGRAVYRLPNGKTIPIRAPGARESKDQVNGLDAGIRALTGKTVTVTTRFVQIGARALGLKDGGLVPGFADGGLPRFPTGGLFRGAGGPRDDANLIAISNGEFITNARDTRRNLPALMAANQGARLIAVDDDRVVAGFANGGLAGAAQEILRHIQRGGTIFEDFSFRGNSNLVRQYNDQLSDLFGKRYRGFDAFGDEAAPNARAAVSNFLRNVSNSAPKRPIPANRLVPSNSVKGSPSATSGGGAGVTVHVSFPNYVGNRAELTRAIRETVKNVGGGNVQKTYGQGR